MKSRNRIPPRSVGVFIANTTATYSLGHGLHMRTLSCYGDRTFAATGPRLWNSLPVQMRNPDITYRLFRRRSDDS